MLGLKPGNLLKSFPLYLGIGGQIEVHADFWGPGKYDQHPGGDRTVTLLGYASTPVGGNTIFPALGLTIKPNKGDVLFWITSNNKGDFDTRYSFSTIGICYVLNIDSMYLLLPPQNVSYGMPSDFW